MDLRIKRTALEMTLDRGGLGEPYQGVSEIEVAFVEDVLGLRKKGDFVRLYRVEDSFGNVIGLTTKPFPEPETSRDVSGLKPATTS